MKRQRFYCFIRFPQKHGYSLEVKIGETPRLANDGKSIICTKDNFVVLVPGLSSYSSAPWSRRVKARSTRGEVSRRCRWARGEEERHDFERDDDVGRLGNEQEAKHKEVHQAAAVTAVAVNEKALECQSW